MAKRHLFGNRTEPRCETCSYGKLTADGSVVLCRRSGAAPKHHHCRHFQYDPLKRTPSRQKPLDAFDAAAFSLSGLGDDDFVAPARDTPLTSGDNEMLERLHAYLNDTAVPDAQSILDILAISPAPAKSESATEDDTALAEEPSEAPIDETPTQAPFDEPAVLTAATQATRVADVPLSTIRTPLTPDNTPNIFEDLKRLQNEASASSTHAAFQDFSLKLGDDITDEDMPEDDPLFTLGTTVLTLDDSDETDDDDTPLATDDLIFGAPDDPDDEEAIETLHLNSDGSIRTEMTKIADLKEY